MEEKLNKKKKIKRALIIVLAVIGLGVTAVQLILMFYLDPKIESYIIKKVKDRSQGQYSLQFDNISINIFTQKVTANQVYLTPIYDKSHKRRIRQDEVNLYTPEISAQGLDLWAALWDKKIILSSVNVDDPVLKVERNSHTDSNPFQYKKFPNYYRLLKGIFYSALIKDITITNGNLELYRLLDLHKNVATVENFDLHIENLLLDSITVKKDRGYLDLGEVEAKLSAFSQRSPDSAYLLSVGSIELSSKESYVHATNINLSPQIRLNKEDVKKTIIYEVYVPELNINNLDIKKLYQARQLSLPSLKVTSPAIKVIGNNLQQNRKDTIAEINFYPLVSEYLRSFNIEKIMLADAKLNIVNLKEDYRINLTGTDIFLYNFKMDSAQSKLRNKLFYSDKVFVKTGGYAPVLIDSIDLSQKFVQRFNPLL